MAVQENAVIQGVALASENSAIQKENLEPSVSLQDNATVTEGSVAQEDTSIEESKEY